MYVYNTKHQHKNSNGKQENKNTPTTINVNKIHKQYYNNIEIIEIFREGEVNNICLQVHSSDRLR